MWGQLAYPYGKSNHYFFVMREEKSLLVVLMLVRVNTHRYAKLYSDPLLPPPTLIIYLDVL